MVLSLTNHIFSRDTCSITYFSITIALCEFAGVCVCMCDSLVKAHGGYGRPPGAIPSLCHKADDTGLIAPSGSPGRDAAQSVTNWGQEFGERGGKQAGGKEQQCGGKSDCD